MNHAQRARDNAISFEVKKDGLQQRQSGDWVLRLTVQAIDMHQTIVAAAMGTRFACVLVEVNDDESPVDHVAIARDKWRELGCAKQAGIRCKEPIFRAYLRESWGWIDVDTEEDAAAAVRQFCGVASRSDFDKPGQNEARLKWHNLDNGFQAWRVAERA
ncbi:hypothetical protein ABID65_006678 [Bradyrhizobium sp. S3.9.2]|uniref:hypothetical protein n=1 Tax=Bradyrhizobium sp. S3.9.2 TaxID=3156432 RepID=UPI0033991B9E